MKSFPAMLSRHPRLRFFLLAAAWFLMALLIVASVSLRDTIAVQQDPFLYENF